VTNQFPKASRRIATADVRLGLVFRSESRKLVQIDSNAFLLGPSDQIYPIPSDYLMPPFPIRLGSIRWIDLRASS
jgi:hypothetical protein